MDSDEGSDNIEQLDHSGAQPSNEYVELTSTDEQPRMSSIDDQSSSDCPEVQLAAVGSGDFGNIVQHNIHLTDHHKLTLLKKHFVPASDYKFPTRVINGVQRHFQYSWLGRYPGLVYSKSQNGGYCKYCILFGKHEPSVKELGIFVTKPFTNFKKATEQLGGHFHGTGISKGSKTHHNAMQDATTFMMAMEKKGSRIDHHLSSLQSKQVEENRLKIRSIAETIVFCGRQGIALRGHRDDRPSVEEDPAKNHGNFLALLQFRDKVLSDHLKSAGGNATYTSKTIQNELIEICGDIIRDKILAKIRQAKYFSVIADEATDVSNDEQLSISIRYVDDGTPTEVFVAFYECVTGVTGRAIADNILLKLSEWQLELEHLRGQAYDGAGAMAGKSKGAASYITTKQPKALYTHCASHRLNLCVMKCCSIREISNMMESADKISRFFNNSPKRQLALQRWIDELFTQHEKRKKVKDMCRTRWVERHEAFEVFTDLFMPVRGAHQQIGIVRPDLMPSRFSLLYLDFHLL